MKKTILFSIMFLTFNLYSQTKEGFYVTNSLDTVKCKIELPTYNGKLDFYAFYGSVKVDIDGVKKKYKPKKIQSFTVYNIDSVNYKFMSFETERYFVNVLVEGGLTLCKVYNPHPYDHSPGFVYALIKNNKIKHLNLFNTHGAVGKLISDYPGLYKDWAVDKKYSTSDLVEVVKAYNAYTSHQ